MEFLDVSCIQVLQIGENQQILKLNRLWDGISDVLQKSKKCLWKSCVLYRWKILKKKKSAWDMEEKTLSKYKLKKNEKKKTKPRYSFSKNVSNDFFSFFFLFTSFPHFFLFIFFVFILILWGFFCCFFFVFCFCFVFFLA